MSSATAPVAVQPLHARRLHIFSGCLTLALLGACYAAFNVVGAAVAQQEHLSSVEVALVAYCGVLGSWLHLINGPFVSKYGPLRSVGVGFIMWMIGLGLLVFSLSPEHATHDLGVASAKSEMSSSNSTHRIRRRVDCKGLVVCPIARVVYDTRNGDAPLLLGGYCPFAIELALYNFISMQGASFATMAALSTVPVIFPKSHHADVMGIMGATFALGQVFVSTMYSTILRHMTLSMHFLGIMIFGVVVMGRGALILLWGRTVVQECFASAAPKVKSIAAEGLYGSPTTVVAVAARTPQLCSSTSGGGVSSWSTSPAAEGAVPLRQEHARSWAEPTSQYEMPQQQHHHLLQLNDGRVVSAGNNNNYNLLGTPTTVEPPLRDEGILDVLVHYRTHDNAPASSSGTGGPSQSASRTILGKAAKTLKGVSTTAATDEFGNPILVVVASEDVLGGADSDTPSSTHTEDHALPIDSAVSPIVATNTITVVVKYPYPLTENELQALMWLRRGLLIASIAFFASHINHILNPQGDAVDDDHSLPIASTPMMVSLFVLVWFALFTLSNTSMFAQYCGSSFSSRDKANTLQSLPAQLGQTRMPVPTAAAPNHFNTQRSIPLLPSTSASAMGTVASSNTAARVLDPWQASPSSQHPRHHRTHSANTHPFFPLSGCSSNLSSPPQAALDITDTTKAVASGKNANDKIDEAEKSFDRMVKLLSGVFGSKELWLMLGAYFACAGLASALNAIASSVIASLQPLSLKDSHHNAPMPEVLRRTGEVYALAALGRCWGGLAVGTLTRRAAGAVRKAAPSATSAAAAYSTPHSSRLDVITLCMLCHAVNVFAYFLLYTGVYWTDTSIYLTLPFIGMLWGMLYTLSQVCAIEVFGIHKFPTLWGVLSSSPCVSTYLFSVLVAGKSADAALQKQHAEKYYVMGHEVCLGPQCYAHALLIFLVFALAGACCFALLRWRRQQVAQ